MMKKLIDKTTEMKSSDLLATANSAQTMTKEKIKFLSIFPPF
jgi:hypothetical protein